VGARQHRTHRLGAVEAAVGPKAGLVDGKEERVPWEEGTGPVDLERLGSVFGLLARGRTANGGDAQGGERMSITARRR
jgi:hypothetical protein